MPAANEIADEIFEASLIRPEQARKAYPLIRHTYPSVTLDQWLAFTRQWTRLPHQRGGILAVQDKRAYVHAIFSYHVDSHLPHSLMLRVSDLVIGRLPGRIIDRAIIRNAERLASEVGCRFIVFELPQSGRGNVDPANRSALEKAGYVPCSISYLRREWRCELGNAILPARR